MAEQHRLRKHLGLPSVFAICTGAMFSSGFFLLPGLAADEVGPALPLMYVLAGLAVLPATLCVAELASGIPRAGGPYLFLSRAMGPAAATIGGIGTWVQLLFKSAFSFVGVGYYLSLVVDLPIVPVAIGLVALFTALNLLGAQQTAAVEIGMVVVLLVLLVYFVVAGAVELAVEPRALRERFTPLLPFGGGGVLVAMALVAVSYSGIGQVASVAGEVEEPARTMPRGMLGALAVATTLYAAGTALMVALLPAEVLRDDVRPVATAAAQMAALPLPVWVIVIAALAAFMSTGNAGILSAARYPLAMARDGFVWGRLAQLDASGNAPPGGAGHRRGDRGADPRARRRGHRQARQRLLPAGHGGAVRCRARAAGEPQRGLPPWLPRAGLPVGARGRGGGQPRAHRRIGSRDMAVRRRGRGRRVGVVPAARPRAGERGLRRLGAAGGTCGAAAAG